MKKLTVLLSVVVLLLGVSGCLLVGSKNGGGSDEPIGPIILFEDDFSDGSQWWIDDNFKASKIEDGKLVLGIGKAQGGATISATQGQFRFSDYEMTFDLEVVNVTNADNGGVIRFFLTNRSDMWWDDGTLAICFSPIVGQERYSLLFRHNSDKLYFDAGVDVEQPKEIKVYKKGADMRIYMDDTLVAELEFSGDGMKVDITVGSQTQTLQPQSQSFTGFKYYQDTYIGFFGTGDATAYISNMQIVAVD